MATWTITMAVALASLMLAGPAFAQGTTGSPATGSKDEQPKGTPDKPDSAAQMPRGSDTKLDTMKPSDTMKSDTMKSGSGMKSSGMRRKDGMTMAGDEKVKAAQQALKDKGHDPGGVDGRLGPKTQAAIRDFQKAQGMQATGRLDNKTMQALGVESGKLGSAGESGTSGSASPSTSAGPSGSGAASEKKGEEKK